MSEITRKALEGMGFESRGGLNYYSMVFDSGWVSISYNIAWDKEPKVSCSMFAKGKRLKHIRTLPQLRQLIRALFGDDALPRRELSSITDEEIRRVCEIALENLEILEIGKEEGGNVIYLLFIDNGERFETHIDLYFSGEVVGDISPTKVLVIQSHLINELDMYLPAFHGNKGGEQ